MHLCGGTDRAHSLFPLKKNIMEKSLQSNESLQILGEVTANMKICMFATTDYLGKIRSRPMTTMQMDEKGSLWFFANVNSDLSGEIKNDGLVCLSYYDCRSESYMSITGVAALVSARKKIDELWDDDFEKWYEGGKEDPALTLIRVNPEEVLYWDQASSKLISIVSNV